jgi:hypothetical protein
VIASAAEAGEKAQASAASLPAATTTTMFCRTSEATTSFCGAEPAGQRGDGARKHARTRTRTEVRQALRVEGSGGAVSDTRCTH